MNKATQLWDRLMKSYTFKEWYRERVARCTKNLYDYRTGKLVNPAKFNQVSIPTIQMFVSFVLSVDATINISASSVEREPIMICRIQYLDIDIKRISTNVSEAVAVAVCEFALEYDIKQIIQEGAD